jgi:hypothetical protein
LLQLLLQQLFQLMLLLMLLLLLQLLLLLLLQLLLLLYSFTSSSSLTRDEILGHVLDKRLKSFAPCYSQSLLLADFTENHTLLWFQIYIQKSELGNSSLFMNKILENGKMRLKNLSLRRLELMPRNLD